MWKIIERKTVTLDVERASLWLKLDSRYSRAAVPSVVEKLAQMMREGKFVPGFFELSSIVSDGVEYQGNGQHVCRAILETAKSYPVVQVKYSCNPDEIATVMRRMNG